MKILVCISKTPDTTAKIAFTDNNRKFVTDGVQWILNPYDEWYALVRAIEIKRKRSCCSVSPGDGGWTRLRCGDPKALALGGDEAIRINTEPGDSFYVASQIAADCKRGGYDLILTGKETIDFNGASVGGMLGGITGFAFYISGRKLELSWQYRSLWSGK